jgi:hypothetical protein
MLRILLPKNSEKQHRNPSCLLPDVIDLNSKPLRDGPKHAIHGIMAGCRFP